MEIIPGEEMADWPPGLQNRVLPEVNTTWKGPPDTATSQGKSAAPRATRLRLLGGCGAGPDLAPSRCPRIVLPHSRRLRGPQVSGWMRGPRRAVPRAGPIWRWKRGARGTRVARRLLGREVRVERRGSCGDQLAVSPAQGGAGARERRELRAGRTGPAPEPGLAARPRARHGWGRTGGRPARRLTCCHRSRGPGQEAGEPEDAADARPEGRGHGGSASGRSPRGCGSSRLRRRPVLARGRCAAASGADPGPRQPLAPPPCAPPASVPGPPLLPARPAPPLPTTLPIRFPGSALLQSRAPPSLSRIRACRL